MQAYQSFRATLRLGSLFIVFGALLALPPAAQSQPAKDKQRPPGGVEFQMPQSPELKSLRVGYIREMAEAPRPASRLDVEPEDAGIAGAKMAIEENNAGGKFMGDLY